MSEEIRELKNKEVQINQLYLDQLGTPSSCWLYDLHIQDNGMAIVHIPLIYLTRLRIQQELYALALKEFPLLLGLNNIFQPVIRDGVVVIFPVQQYQNFKNSCYYQIINNPLYSQYLAKQSIIIKKWLPKLCYKAEQDLYNNKNVSKLLLVRLFRLLSRIIAISLVSSFVEQAFIQLNTKYYNDNDFKEAVNSIIWPPIFSHMAYYSRELKNLEEKANDETINNYDILKFCKDVSFLENGIGDGSPYENPDFVRKLLSISETDKEVTDKFDVFSINEPCNINFDNTGLTDKWPDIDDQNLRLLYLMRFLQVNEEFRHYWGLRIIRLFRLIAPDLESKESRGLDDFR